MDGQTDIWMVEWMDMQTDERTEGQMDRQMEDSDFIGCCGTNAKPCICTTI